MNQTQIDDLKAFLEVTIENKTRAVFSEQFDEKILPFSQQLDRLDKKIDGAVLTLGEAISRSSDATDEQFTNHEQRITKLEQARTI